MTTNYQRFLVLQILSNSNAINQCYAIVDYELPVANDNCPNVMVELQSGFAPESNFPVGTTAVVYKAVDTAGNESSCTFNVTVNDEQQPISICPLNINVDTSPSSCGALVSYSPLDGIDNCPGSSTELTSGLGPNSFFPLGTTVEQYTTTDASGNTSICSFEITVVDTEIPTISCPENIAVNNDEGLCGASVSYGAPVGNDNCSGISINLESGVGNGGFFPIGLTVEEYMITDASGNTNSCSFNIEVIDIENPVIECQNISLNLDVDGQLEFDPLNIRGHS